MQTKLIILILCVRWKSVTVNERVAYASAYEWLGRCNLIVNDCACVCLQVVEENRWMDGAVILLQCFGIYTRG